MVMATFQEEDGMNDDDMKCYDKGHDRGLRSFGLSLLL